jgi:hypothetical protein
MVYSYNDSYIVEPVFWQEFQLIDRSELAPLSELIDPIILGS